MAGSYALIGARPLIQVTSPTTRREVQDCTISTSPSGSIVRLWVDKAAFDSGAAGPELAAFADNIETVIAQGKAIGATGDTTLDDNGLQQVFVTFTVGYSPQGVPAGQITTDVDVPVGLLSNSGNTSAVPSVQQVEAMIDAAYNNLVATAGGSPDLQAPPPTLPPPTPQTAA